MLYPLPAVLIGTRNGEGRDNLCTVAWTGTVCSDPAMLSISLRPSRLSYDYLVETGVFTVNLTTEDLAEATDFCGVRSGRDIDKYEVCRLTKTECEKISCAFVEESPVAIECRVTEKRELGSHTMFIAEVLLVHADTAYMNEDGAFDFDLASPIVYSHGRYKGLGKDLGGFGFSVKGSGGKGRRRGKKSKG